jgi:hypothetical protein
MAEHRRRYVLRWLKERLHGRPARGDLLHELKQWPYDHRIFISHDRLLKRLIVQAVQHLESALTDALLHVFGEATVDNWGRVLSKAHDNHHSTGHAA